MKVKIKILFLFLLYFFTINQLFAQFTGGAYDGFYVYTTPTASGLNGEIVSTVKYTGGNHDGYILITGVIMQLDGQQINWTKYAGGNHDGYNLITGVIMKLDGQQINWTKYAGGIYDGYASGISFTDVSLPVTLTLFVLSEIPRQTVVKIEWRTESEIENAYWLLLRKTESNTFKTLQKFAGNGNSSTVSDYVYRDGEVEAGRNYSYQLADVSINGQITYHEEKSIAVSVPKSFELFQNYPNPFNPNTNIKYALPVTAKVQLKIYNILGQKVVDLLDQHKKAGYHKVQWDGRNSHGNAVSSGMYIYLMLAESAGNSQKEHFQKVKRMLLLR